MRGKSSRASARVKDNVAITLGCFRASKSEHRASAPIPPRGVDIDERDIGPGNLPAKKCDQRADRAGADDGHTIGGPTPASQTALSAVSMFPASTRTSGGKSSGQHSELGGDIEQALMRMQRKDATPAQILRPVFDLPTVGVAVFDRETENFHPSAARACADTRSPARGRQIPAPGTSAERTKERAHPRLALGDRRKRFLSYFGLTRRDIPERLSKLVCRRARCELNLDALKAEMGKRMEEARKRARPKGPGQ